MKRRTFKITLISVAVLIIILIAGLGYMYSVASTGFKIDKTVYVYIDENKNYDQLLLQVDTAAHVKNLNHFKTVARAFSYPENMKVGRYAVTKDMNVLDLVRILRSGHQSPVKLTFNNIRTKDDLTERLSSQLMLTNTDLLKSLNDSAICNRYGFTTDNIGCMFVPNTYEFYWDVALNKFLDRMDSEYEKFWTEKRTQQSKDLGLSPIEVSILASIVEEECYFSDEYPVVAGLYLNRLRKGQMLQADPTVKFAVGDFSLKRVLNKHLAVESPYNTYKNIGLPPGPIRIPSIKAIDGTLNAAKHDYIFMCAKEDFSGRHNFAVTGVEHSRNRARYIDALNKRKIF